METKNAYGIFRVTAPWRRITKPLSMPVGAPAVAVAASPSVVLPPGATVITGGSSSDAPAVADCGRSSTVHVPAPPPASWTVKSICLRAAPFAGLTSPNESEAGSLKMRGSSAAWTLISPAPSSSTEASFVRNVSPQAGPAVDMSADLTCAGDQLGWRSRRSAAAPETCGAAMLVPSKTANGPPEFGSVDERIAPPGAETSGLSACSYAVGPADEKLVTIPLRPVAMSSNERPTRIVVRPPRVAM